MTLGKRMKVLRIFHGHKQKELAAKLGVKPTLLSMFENDKRDPNLAFLREYTKALNISFRQLFTGVQ
jgi:XRE family transcriptional regulator, fatty acid utilization regulator